MLSEVFYAQPVQTVASTLLGKYLVCSKRTSEIAYMITEVEAYDGECDLACHASKGRTARTEVMYGEAGHWYVYLCYGMHWMLNIVTGPKDYPAAVLIRGVHGISGPGRLTKALSIGAHYNTLPAKKATGLWIEDRGIVVPQRYIEQTPRIGVAYAKEWAEKPWRFVLSDDAIL